MYSAAGLVEPMNEKKSENPQGTEEDRRQHQRVTLSAKLVARHVGRGESFTVDEASVGGFSITTTTVFEPGSQHHFRFAGPSGETSIIGAECRHCSRLEREGEGPAYRAGFQFLSQPTRRLRIILGAIAAEAP